jgi:hypothetical protein
LDYAIWARIKTIPCRVCPRNVEVLRAKVYKVWANMSKVDVVKICKALWQRLEKCFEIERNTNK